MRVLVPNNDHGFYEASVVTEVVVKNKRTGEFYEYHGSEELLTEDEEIVAMVVAR